jgi:hypothetical protein
MSFLSKARNAPWYEGGMSTMNKIDPLNRVLSGAVAGAFAPKTAAPPQLNNPNDALNAAQAQTDAMRMRRGMLANIYAGGSNSAPVVGKSQLGT